MAIAEMELEIQQGNAVLVDRVETLLRVLDLELGQYQDIMDMLYKQRECFVTGGTEAVVEANKGLGTVVLKIKILDEARKAIVKELARDFDIPHEEVTLAKLAMLVDSYYRVKCGVYRMKTLCLIRWLETYTESSIYNSSAYMVQQALGYVNRILKIFASTYAAGFVCTHFSEEPFNNPKGLKDENYRYNQS